jgi:hypothetical protein
VESARIGIILRSIGNWVSTMEATNDDKEAQHARISSHSKVEDIEGNKVEEKETRTPSPQSPYIILRNYCEKYKTFEDLEKIDGVRCAASEQMNNPILDTSVTIFLKNGYRVISTKDLFGQTLEVDPFEKIVIENPSLKAMVFNNSVPLMANKVIEMPQPRFYKVENGVEEDITQTLFVEMISPILGEELLSFITARNDIIPYYVN